MTKAPCAGFSGKFALTYAIWGFLMPYLLVFSKITALAATVIAVVMVLYTLWSGPERGVFAVAIAMMCGWCLFLAYAMGLAQLALRWTHLYAFLIAGSVLSSTFPKRASSICIGSLAGVILTHLLAVCEPVVFPIRNMQMVMSLRLTDMPYMLGYFLSYFVFGYGVAVFQPMIAQSPLVPVVQRWMGLSLLIAIPVGLCTVPDLKGYSVIVGNFPTYESQELRIAYHTGGWLWLAIMHIIAYLVTQGPPPSEHVCFPSHFLFRTHCFCDRRNDI